MKIKYFSHFELKAHFLSKMLKMSTSAHFCVSGAQKSWYSLGSIATRVRRREKHFHENILWKHFHGNVFCEKLPRKYFKREEHFATKFVKMPVGSFAYETCRILRILGAGNQKNQHFHYFRVLLKKVNFWHKSDFLWKLHFLKKITFPLKKSFFEKWRLRWFFRFGFLRPNTSVFKAKRRWNFWEVFSGFDFWGQISRVLKQNFSTSVAPAPGRVTASPARS